MEAQVTAAQTAATAAQAEKAFAEDQVQRLEGERASLQRQLDEVSAQLQQERAKANALETKSTVFSAEAEVCLCSLVAEFTLYIPLGCLLMMQVVRRWLNQSCLPGSGFRSQVTGSTAVGTHGCIGSTAGS
jgi:hypothetical protein